MRCRFSSLIAACLLASLLQACSGVRSGGNSAALPELPNPASVAGQMSNNVFIGLDAVPYYRRTKIQGFVRSNEALPYRHVVIELAHGRRIAVYTSEVPHAKLGDIVSATGFLNSRGIFQAVSARIVESTPAGFLEGWENHPLDVAWIDGSTYGAWVAAYNGYGVTAVNAAGISRYLSLAPQAATSASETHAALVTSVALYGDLDVSAGLSTVAQLRRASPNPWEVPWLLWHYTDDNHFYYLILKPNGWELGKEDPQYAGAQRYLATGSSPTFALGHHTARITQRGNIITVFGDGTLLTQFVDRQTPYLTGSIGLYTEDAHADFDRIALSF